MLLRINLSADGWRGTGSFEAFKPRFRVPVLAVPGRLAPGLPELLPFAVRPFDGASAPAERAVANAVAA